MIRAQIITCVAVGLMFGTSTGALASPNRSGRCSAVAHVGDSISVGLMSTSLPKDQRIESQYASQGVSSLTLELSGGRSIVERLAHQQNGESVARSIAARRFHGCWVIALGTNDAGNIGAGSPVGATTRIDRMMAITNGEPTLWITVKSLRTTGAYADSNMAKFNVALRDATTQFATWLFTTGLMRLSRLGLLVKGFTTPTMATCSDPITLR
jgi:hypothetical protein